MNILDDGGRGVAGTGYNSNMMSGLVDDTMLQKSVENTFDIKRLSKDIVDMSNKATSTAFNNIAFATNANMARGATSPYQTISTNTTNAVSDLASGANSAAGQIYIDGVNQYIDSLDSLYSFGSEMIAMQMDAELFDYNQELAWANQALSEEEYDLAVAEFDEQKRHTNAMYAKAKAEAESKAASKQSNAKRIYESIMGGGDSGGNIFGYDVNTHPDGGYYRGEDGELYYNGEVVPGSGAYSDEMINEIIKDQSLTTDFNSSNDGWTPPRRLFRNDITKIGDGK